MSERAPDSEGARPNVGGPLREPEPERPSELERRIRERDRRVPWVRIVVLAAALVGILVFHGTITSKVAGCYGQYVEPTGRPAAKPGESPTPELRIEPARRLPSGGGAP